VAINVFEGARRVNKIIIGAIAIGGLVIVWNNVPYLPLNYQVSRLGNAPVKVEECDPDAAIEYIDRKSAGGKVISIRLCFKAQPAAETGEMLIPYKFTEDGSSSVWMRSKYSAEVTKYTKSVASTFMLPADVAKDADSLWMKTRFTEAIQGLGWTAVWLFAFVVATYLIGWIVRGFAGIPNGQDRRAT